MSENFEEINLSEMKVSPDILQTPNIPCFLSNSLLQQKNSSHAMIQISDPNIKTDFSDANLLSSDRNLTELIDKLKPMGFNPNVALFLIYFYSLKNENQIFEYLTTDGFDKYKHPFIAKVVDSLTICSICDKNIASHHILPDLELHRAQTIYNSIEHLKLKKLILIDPEQLQLEQCQICCFLIPKSLMLMMNDECHQICLECLHGYLKTEISSNKVKNMHCPHCDHLLEKELIKQIVDEPTFLKYTLFLKNIQVLENPLLRFCPKCSTIIQLIKENDEKVTCTQCKLDICPKCNHIFHNEIPCEKILNRELEGWSKHKEVQRCPNCKILVEKLDGCNHMKCFICHYEFCWLCRAAYTSIHFFPLNPLGCPGLQSVKTKLSAWNFIKIWVFRLLCLIFCIVLLPFAVIFYLPILFFIQAFDSSFYRRKIKKHKWIVKLLWVIFLAIICIVLEPIFLAVEAIGLVPLIIVGLVFYFKERYRRYKNVKEFNFYDKNQFELRNNPRRANNFRRNLS